MIGGAEYDGLTRWKRFLKWRAGMRKWIKRKYNKRFRYYQKQDINTINIKDQSNEER